MFVYKAVSFDTSTSFAARCLAYLAVNCFCISGTLSTSSLSYSYWSFSFSTLSSNATSLRVIVLEAATPAVLAGESLYQLLICTSLVRACSDALYLFLDKSTSWFTAETYDLSATKTCKDTFQDRHLWPITNLFAATYRIWLLLHYIVPRFTRIIPTTMIPVVRHPERLGLNMTYARMKYPKNCPWRNCFRSTITSPACLVVWLESFSKPSISTVWKSTEMNLFCTAVFMQFTSVYRWIAMAVGTELVYIWWENAINQLYFKALGRSTGIPNRKHIFIWPKRDV